MFDKWKRKPASDHVFASGELRCSFCAKAQADVRKLIAGPEVFICDECVNVCNDILVDAERSTKPEPEVAVRGTPDKHRAAKPVNDKVACSLCGSVVVITEALNIKDRGVLCGECADAVDDALSEGRPRS